MSHYIVLVKQVPDVSQITDNAFDPKTGNLIRTRLPSVINELDAQALAFAQHMKTISQDKLPLHKMMAEVLELFGTSVLTSRETHVVHLILKGYSAKSIAEHLVISINTVKLHRKNAYAKLDISSQSELFHLFIDSLSCIDESCTRDPLVTYLQVPGQ